MVFVLVDRCLIANSNQAHSSDWRLLIGNLLAPLDTQQYLLHNQCLVAVEHNMFLSQLRIWRHEQITAKALSAERRKAPGDTDHGFFHAIAGKNDCISRLDVSVHREKITRQKQLRAKKIEMPQELV